MFNPGDRGNLFVARRHRTHAKNGNSSGTKQGFNARGGGKRGDGSSRRTRGVEKIMEGKPGLCHWERIKRIKGKKG